MSHGICDLYVDEMEYDDFFARLDLETVDRFMRVLEGAVGILHAVAPRATSATRRLECRVLRDFHETLYWHRLVMMRR